MWRSPRAGAEESPPCTLRCMSLFISLLSSVSLTMARPEASALDTRPAPVEFPKPFIIGEGEEKLKRLRERSVG